MKKWYCPYCETFYDEYVNGCPRCYLGEVGTSTSVICVNAVKTKKGWRRIVPCQRCNEDQIVKISGKVSDTFCARFRQREYNGYVPKGLGIGSGDYVDFSFCASCGQIQGSFPNIDNVAVVFDDGGEEEPDFSNRYGFSG